MYSTYSNNFKHTVSCTKIFVKIVELVLNILEYTPFSFHGVFEGLMTDLPNLPTFEEKKDEKFENEDHLPIRRTHRPLLLDFKMPSKGSGWISEIFCS